VRRWILVVKAVGIVFKRTKGGRDGGNGMRKAVVEVVTEGCVRLFGKKAYRELSAGEEGLRREVEVRLEEGVEMMLCRGEGVEIWLSGLAEMGGL
jgi:hypothetical protein